MEKGKYIELKDLEVYQLARKLSDLAWAIGLMKERNIIPDEQNEVLLQLSKSLQIKLNNFISTTRKNAKK